MAWLIDLTLADAEAIVTVAIILGCIIIFWKDSNG